MKVAFRTEPIQVKVALRYTPNRKCKILKLELDIEVERKISNNRNVDKRF